MESVEHRLRLIDFHDNWNIKDTVKLFSSLKQSIEEHLQNSPSIEAYFFCSYMWMSDIKGIGHKDPTKATENNDNAFHFLLSKLKDRPTAIRDGYESIYLALDCWLAFKNDESASTVIEKLEKVEKLVEKYLYASEEQKLFKASIHATKGFAFGRLSFARYHESQSEFRLATDADPMYAEWLFMFGLMSWRIGKYSLGRFYTSSSLDDVKNIMDKVLELKPDHAYAMVIKADILRRKYEHNEHNKKIALKQYSDNGSLRPDTESSSKENEARKRSEIREIVELLETSVSKTSRPKIFSLVAQCYIRMGSALNEKNEPNNTEIQKEVPKSELLCSTETNYNYFSEAYKVIREAKKRFTNPIACLVFQEGMLYREQKLYEKQLQCLDLAIQLDPSNIATSIEKAKALTFIGKQKEALALYNTLPSNFKDYPVAYFDINFSFAKYLYGQKEYDMAASKNKKCIEIALESFVNKKVPGKVVFFESQWGKIKKAISDYRYYLERKRRENPQDIKPKQELAMLHHNLMHYGDECCCFLEALGAIWTNGEDCDQEKNIRLGLANATLKSGNLDKASKMLEYFNGMDLNEKLKKDKSVMETYVRVAKGQSALKRGKYQEAENHFKKAIKDGTLEGANGLLKAIKEKKDKNFFKNCALIKNCIEKKIGEDKLMLQADLHKAVLSFDENCLLWEPLKELRECELDMEYSYLLSPELASKEIGFVIHKARSTLNYAVRMFRDSNYPGAKAEKKWEDNSDFFIIRKGNARSVEDNIVYKLKNMGWDNFRDRFRSLLKFLVSIQPLSNPEKNNWLIQFIDLDNFQKHECSLTVFKNKDGKLVDKNVNIIDVARSACIHIKPILDQFLAHVN